MFYKRKERTLRVSIFFGGAALAGAFGGILAWSIATPGHIKNQHLKGWQFLFLIEGESVEPFSIFFFCFGSQY
jgi:MFS family permease